MSAPSLRTVARDPREPSLHDLAPIRVEGRTVPVRLVVRRADDGAWRARLQFGEGSDMTVRETAEIFCGVSEQDLWQSVAGMRDHHFRDLYRSLG